MHMINTLEFSIHLQTLYQQAGNPTPRGPDREQHTAKYNQGLKHPAHITSISKHYTSRMTITHHERRDRATHTATHTQGLGHLAHITSFSKHYTSMLTIPHHEAETEQHTATHKQGVGHSLHITSFTKHYPSRLTIPHHEAQTEQHTATHKQGVGHPVHITSFSKHYPRRLTIPHHEAEREQHTLLHTSRDRGTQQHHIHRHTLHQQPSNPKPLVPDRASHTLLHIQGLGHTVHITSISKHYTNRLTIPHHEDKRDQHKLLHTCRD